MKTISKRFLKASVAMLLVVIMLFSSTISGFAAVVDNADTKANVDLADTDANTELAETGFTIPSGTGNLVMFNNTLGWSDVYVYTKNSSLWRSDNNGCTTDGLTGKKMTQISGTNYYYIYISTKYSYVLFTSSKVDDYDTVWQTNASYRTDYNTSYPCFTPIDWNHETKNETKYYSKGSWSKFDVVTTSLSIPEGSGNLVIFNNTRGWSSVYLYTSSSELYTADNGCTTKGADRTDIKNISGTDYWYAYVADTSHLLFLKDKQDNYDNIWSTEAVYKEDYHSAYQIFTPSTSKSEEANSTVYYSNGTWSKYVSAVTEYTVTFDENTGSGAPVSATVEEGTDYTIPTTVPTKTGHTFKEWNTAANGSGTSYNAGDTISNVTDDITLYAQYTKNKYTVTFKDWDGSQIGDTQTIEYGGTATVPADPERANYVFQGWSSNGTTVTGVASPVTANATYTAIYKINQYTVTFVDHDGTVIDTVTVDHGSDATPPADPTRTGYDFAGWEGSYNNVTENTTVTATYTIKTYTITVVVSPDGGGEATVNDGNSATVEHGQEITLKAVPSEGYRFHAWVINGRDVASTAEFIVAPEGDATYTATFKKIWDVTVVVPEGVTSVGYQGGNPSSTTTYEDITEGWSSPFTATVSTGYELVGWEVKKVDADGKETIETFDTATINVTVDANTTITPVVKKLYNVTVSGVEATGTGYYAPGDTVTLTVTNPDDKYMTSASAYPATTLSVDSINGTITFVMPESDVTLTPVFSNYSYIEIIDSDVMNITGYKTAYKANEEVTLTLTPKNTSTTITALDSSYDGAVITNSNGTWTVEIATMPADTTVTLTPTVDAKFVMKSKQVAVGNYGTGVTVFGTVKMSVDGTTLTEGGYADRTDTVKYEATASDNYTFVGFYTDEACTKLITSNSTYEVTPTADTTVYALFARKQWMTFDLNKISTSDCKELVYDPALGAYTLVTTLSSDDSTSDSIAKDAWFRVTNNTSWPTTNSYDNPGSDFTLTFNKNAYGGATVSDNGTQCWILDASSCESDSTVTFILTPTGNTGIDFSAKVTKEGATIYLSSGWKDMPKSLNPTSEFTSTVNGSTTKDLEHKVNNDYYDTESYTKATITTAQTVSFKTTLSGDDAANYYVDSFVVYDILDKTYTIVEPNSAGSNVYEGTVYVDNDCYIVPIFFHTDAYIASQEGYKTIELYFDATSIQGTAWGPFVSAYAYGDDWYTGVWTGQMMIPTEDGSSWYTQISVPEDGLSGIVFNNYLYDTCPSTNAGVFGVTGTNLQTYDYREALTLYQLKYEVITFVAKTSKDGYHGDDRNHVGGSMTDYYVDKETKALSGKYVFDYLYARDGVTPMDLNAEPIENAVKSYDEKGSVNNADYYIISSGDHHYDDTHYSEDTNYNGEWSVEWFVFNNKGEYITNVLSDGFYNDADKDGDTYLIEKIKEQGYENIDGALVAISYEAPNQGAGDTQLSYDGQWYGSMLDDTVKGSVIVGLDDGAGNFILDETDPVNDADYGEGYLVDLEGNTHQTLDIKMDYGIADLSASSKTGYRFIGWYTKTADGKYVQINNAPSYSTYINMNTTYYAIFRELGEAEVVINHRKYVNDDPAIPSHNGTGELLVNVYDANGNPVGTQGTISTSSSTATFPAEENTTYTIRITTTPLMNGKFFAWYTDSERADGTKTFEEVFTREDDYNSTTTVVAEFEYTYDSTDPDLKKLINIYSDIIRVSNKANFVYKYINRFGQPKTYTVKDVELTDAECTGKNSDNTTFAGNDGKEYCPAYRTELTFSKSGEEDLVIYVPAENEAERIAEYEKAGWTNIKSFNKVTYYAPNEDVTEAYGQDVIWKVEDRYITANTAEVILTAYQTDCVYDITYQIGDGGTTTLEDIPYDELIHIEAPGTFDGKKFAYWVEIKDGEPVFLTYLQNYRYRVTETKHIKAVYLDDVSTEEIWTPSINSVNYTREISDTSDYIYTDYLLAFNNNKGLELNEVKLKEDGTYRYKYGLLLVRDSAYYYEPTTKIEVEYPDYAKLKANLEEVAFSGTNQAFTVDGTKYNCYNYDISANNLTNLNRCNYFRQYDNGKVVGGSHYYREYAFTAVAYLIDVDKNKIYLSDHKYVNFYELGMKDKDTIKGN